MFGLFNVGFPMTLSMVADSVDYMELKTGLRTDGTAYATYGLATKFGNAVGGAVGVLLLGLFGYVANAEQTAEALRGINIVVNLLPAILFFLGAPDLLKAPDSPHILSRLLRRIPLPPFWPVQPECRKMQQCRIYLTVILMPGNVSDLRCRRILLLLPVIFHFS